VSGLDAIQRGVCVRHVPRGTRQLFPTFKTIRSLKSQGPPTAAQSEHPPVSKQDHTDRVWQIVEEVGVCMLTTRSADGLRARPLEARPDRDAGLIFFVTDIRSAKEDEIEASPDVCLVFISSKDKAYLSITGRASVTRDAEKTKLVWRKTDEVWWRGPDDPDVCLLRMEPLTAELWDGPASAVVTAFEFAKARLTGGKPNVGENRKVTVQM
jgi:general stress protein 26